MFRYLVKTCFATFARPSTKKGVANFTENRNRSLNLLFLALVRRSVFVDNIALPGRFIVESNRFELEDKIETERTFFDVLL